MAITRRLALGLIALWISGCGGGDSGGVTPPPSQQQSNRPPIVKGGLTEANAVAMHPVDFDLSVGGTAFSDPDGDPLTYSVRSFGGTGLSGLSVTGTHLTGTAPDVGWFQVTLTVSDGRGGTLDYILAIRVTANSAPGVVRPNDVLLVGPGAQVSYDVTQGGTTFADPDQDALTYQISLSAQARGLSVTGTRVTGVFSEVGAVRVKVTAMDEYGGSAEHSFVIAMPAPDPGSPVLPAISYTYDDDKLPLPPVFRLSRQIQIPLWDTTPVDNPTSDAGATLGRVLFYDKRLSITNTHSCGTCHEQVHGFANSTPFSIGVAGEPTKRNAMGLTNARYNLRNTYFADERVSTLEKLALMPIEDPIELGNSLPRVVEKLAATDFYPPLFEAAFGTPEITSERIAKALAQFVRTLISYQSKTDEYENPPEGQPQPDPSTVYTPQELAGKNVFLAGQCFFCHNDTNKITFDSQNNGLDETPSDLGAGGGRFRAASLKNIGRTAPYMHDGRFATLRDVVEHYDHGVKDSVNLSALLGGGSGGRRLNLSEEDKEALVAFLNTLTDEKMLADPRFSDPFQ